MSYIANNVYIDELHIGIGNSTIDENSYYYTGTNTYANQASGLLTDIETNRGFQWVVQITNGAGIDVQTDAYYLRVITYIIKSNGLNTPYLGSQVETVTVDFNDTTASTISNNESFYVGFNLPIIPGGSDVVTVDTDSNGVRLLSDQLTDSTGTAGSGYFLTVSTTFELWDGDPTASGVKIDVLGKGGFRLTSGDAAGSFAWSDVLSSILRTDLSVSGTWSTDGHWNNDGVPEANGSRRRLYRTSGPAVPTTNYVQTDWIYGDSGIYYLNASAEGDPHVTTLDGNKYDFVHLGAARYFSDGNGLYINVDIQKGDYERWGQNDYMRRIYVWYKKQNILIDTGFRGKPVKILKNNGIKVKEHKLSFDKNAYRHSGYTRKKFLTEEQVQKHLLTYPHDIVPEYIRNQIIVHINNVYSLVVENINRLNLQPCRIYLVIKNKKNLDKTKFKGIIVTSETDESNLLDTIETIPESSKSSNN